MNVRTVVQQIFEEARKNYEAALSEAHARYELAIERKLRAFFGASEATAAPTKTPTKAAKSAKKSSGGSKKPAAKEKAKQSVAAKSVKKRDRALPSKIADIRQRILVVMAPEPVKKAALMALAGLEGEDPDRVGNVLRKLKDDGKIVMSGERGSATYALATSSASSAATAN